MCQLQVCVYADVVGVKEIDIAATLEHIRDQRPGMVRTKVECHPQHRISIACKSLRVHARVSM